MGGHHSMDNWGQASLSPRTVNYSKLGISTPSHRSPFRLHWQVGIKEYSQTVKLFLQGWAQPLKGRFYISLLDMGTVCPQPFHLISTQPQFIHPHPVHHCAEAPVQQFSRLSWFCWNGVIELHTGDTGLQIPRWQQTEMLSSIEDIMEPFGTPTPESHRWWPCR